MYGDLRHKHGGGRASPAPQILDIGGVLRGFLAEKKLTGRELARASGVSESEVYNVLKNRRSRAGLATLQKLLHPLGRSLADIFTTLATGDAGNLRRFEKEPSFVMEFRRLGYTVFSDTPPQPAFFIGKISFAGGAKGISEKGLAQTCSIFLRVLKGALVIDYLGKSHTVPTYQKIVFEGRHPHRIANKSATEPAETLLLTVPSFLVLPSS